jgi:DNA-directed RNA polymerase specialized sigma24 family protein
VVTERYRDETVFQSHQTSAYALLQLAGQDAQAAELVKLRFYAGLSVEEAAELLGIARASAYRTWNYAKAWLRTKLASNS